MNTAMIRSFLVACCGCASVAIAQCHPGVIAGGPAAGPENTSTQLLRYDLDGPGPLGPSLVSVGWGHTLFRGVRALDTQNQEWYSLGGSTMQMDSAIDGATFGAGPQDEGPYLAVVAGPGVTSSTSARTNRVYLFDGVIWQRMPDLPRYSGRAISSFDPDGDGPHERALVVLLNLTSPSSSSGTIQGQAVMLEDGRWRPLGDPIAMSGGTQNRLVAWDPDGPEGSTPESLFMLASVLQDDGTYQSRLLRWNGSVWMPLDLAASSLTNLRVMDLDGTGPDPARLVAIGSFSAPTGTVNSAIAFYDGTTWELPPGITGSSWDAVMCDDGSILMASSVLSRVARVDGTWVVKERVSYFPNQVAGGTRFRMACIPDATADRGYRTFGNSFDFSYSMNGTDLPDNWHWRVGEIPPIPVGITSYLTYYIPTPGRGFNAPVVDAAVLRDGSLLVTGGFTSVDGVLSPFIARRDPAGRWHAMWDPVWRSAPILVGELRDGRILALRPTTNAAPSLLYQFDGETWSPYMDLGFEMSAGRVFESDDGVLTFIGFSRRDIASGTCVIVQVRGGEMIPVACGGVNGANSVVMNDGSIIATTSTMAGVPAFETGLARWNGVEWTAMGEGNANAVANLRMMPDGTLVGIKEANRISRWNGMEWVVDPVDSNGRSVTLESFEVVGDDTFIGKGTIHSLPGYYEPRTGTLARMVYIHGTYWEDPVFDSDAFYDLPTEFVAMPDGTTLVIGHLRLNGYVNPYTHFGMFQLSACNTCSPCVADWDESGGVDFADVAAFFVDYEQGNRCADVDDSAGVDATDMAIFFQAYEAGGC